MEVKGCIYGYGFLIALGTTSLGIFVQRKIPNKRPAASSRSVEAALNGSRFGDKVLLRRERGDARVKIKLVLYIL